ncbi:hypothetical protein SUGI_0248380 [Cryptomeria japonica]|uniref:uncharacterized protein LOC131035961 n=1 Tax=Cryptomeria japonica TaxID=3369 RepID=UPI002408A7E5|nr:uncharacterized protein LOC131035961 [Cryptomeria japonica]GLJ15192.1 hypothetical protein SUGI_0248380 [Cryptomeria japonica]
MGTTQNLLPAICAAKQKTIVLDMDNTLLYMTRQHLASCDFSVIVKYGSKDITCCWRKRPHVESLLEELRKHNYEIIVFTSAIKEYADAALDKLDVNKAIDYRLYRDSGTQVKEGYIKDLSKLGRDLKNVFIVDDNPVSYKLQPENAFPIKSFVDDRNDTELLKVIDFCKLAAEADDVREALRMQSNTDTNAETSGNMKLEPEAKRKRL